MSELYQVTVNESSGIETPTLEDEAKKYETVTPVEDRPTWLPEKFKSAEELSKAYVELERKFSSRTTQDDNNAQIDETAKVDEVTEQEVREVVESKGINFDELSSSYWDNGSLNDSQYALLEKSGIPKALVDQFIAGQEAVLEATRSVVFSTVGGEDKYNNMTDWAAKNFSKEEVEVYNRAVNGTDRNAALMAVKGLKGRFEAEVGFEPTHRVTGSAVAQTSAVYRSVAELQKDMGDPKYKNDPAFRRDVEQKLGRSNILG